MASFTPDFNSGLGIASLFALAKEFNTTTTVINNLTSNWSIFLLGWGGICSVPLMKRYGRLPVLWWSQVLGLGFLIGCAVAPNLSTFAAMRCLTAFFSTAPQCVGEFFTHVPVEARAEEGRARTLRNEGISRRKLLDAD